MRLAHRQSGSVLLVVIVLLLLASILTVFTLNMGAFEQRTSGNDLKAKVVGEVAEAGISQGSEYLRQHITDIKNTGKWTLCSATDTSFPCGSVPRLTAAGAQRRSTMYRWSGTGFDFDSSGGISGWEAAMLPIATGNALTSAGNGFVVQNGVGAVLCRVAYKASLTAPTTCTDSDSASPTSVITLVSVAAIPGEGARSTVTKSVGSYNVVANIAGAPPILASGSIDLTGTLQVVTNPNSGGTGVPVSVWSRKDTNKTGTPNTCYYDEFLRYGGGSVYMDAGSPNFPLCDDCGCAGNMSLSYDNSGNVQSKGIDILDGTGGGANSAVIPSEFPCDMFQQVFGTQAWTDTDADYFCETKLMTTYTNPNTQVDVTMGVDEAYLFQNATTIIPSAAVTAANLLQTSQADPYNNYPSSSYSGLVWCQTNCDVGSNKQLGTASNPVLLVIDGSATIQGKVFGMIFLRTKLNGSTLTPATCAGGTPPAYCRMSASEVVAGGNATLQMNAGSVVYGSVVDQGTVAKANGNAAVVYNGDVLTNLLNNPALNKLGGLSGSWTDRTSY